MHPDLFLLMWTKQDQECSRSSDHNLKKEHHHRGQRGKQNAPKVLSCEAEKTRLLLYLLELNLSATFSPRHLGSNQPYQPVFLVLSSRRFPTSPFIKRHISKVDYKPKNGVTPFISIQPDSLFQRVWVRLDAEQLSSPSSLAGRQSIHYSAAGSLLAARLPVSLCQDAVWMQTAQKNICDSKILFTVYGIQRSVKQLERSGNSEHRWLCIWLFILLALGESWDWKQKSLCASKLTTCTLRAVLLTIQIGSSLYPSETHSNENWSGSF